MHLFSLFFIQELTEWEIHFPTGGSCHRRCVKGTFFGTFFHARAERKYEKERRRTAVVPSDDFSAILQPYEMSVHLSKSRVRAADGVPCIKSTVLR